MISTILMVTGDGSHTIYLPALEEYYHSCHGAVQESRHVYIESGLVAAASGKQNLRILEIGFGTGLNALLTATALPRLGIEVEYIGVEAHPLAADEVLQLNYATQIGGAETGKIWEMIHEAPWETFVSISPVFQLQKLAVEMASLTLEKPVDLIYFDAFGPDKQPEMWSDSVFEGIYGWLKPGGMLVTYCAKGEVRRSMIKAGLQVERIQGPPGKREMLRALRPAN